MGEGGGDCRIVVAGTKLGGNVGPILYGKDNRCYLVQKEESHGVIPHEFESLSGYHHPAYEKAAHYKDQDEVKVPMPVI